MNVTNFKTILAIDTSCDETSVAITNGQKVLANVVYSQVQLQRHWGGVVPNLARLAHQEKIDPAVDLCCKRFLKSLGSHQINTVIPEARPAQIVERGSAVRDPVVNKLRSEGDEIPHQVRDDNIVISAMKLIDAVAVTQGPGLAIALEVGIKKAKELSETYKKPLLAVNHMAGHIYSSFAQNSEGNPIRNFSFPMLGFLVSGGHTEIVKWTGHGKYEMLGQKLDDAAGEALDKAGRMLGLGYPAAPALETLSAEVGNIDELKFPRPMKHKDTLDMSFSGLKTHFYYLLKSEYGLDSITGSAKLDAKSLRTLASSYQEAVFDVLVFKLKRAIAQTGIKTIACGGGVLVNKRLRALLRKMVKKEGGTVYFPNKKFLYGDNAAMIGVAAAYDSRCIEGEDLDRVPKLALGAQS